MSLYRQMWLTVLAGMLLAFGTSLAVSLAGARAYVEQQLEAKNTDSAAALALSMSQLPKEAATLELQAASLFEAGQYESIRVRDVGGNILVDMADQPATGGMLGTMLPIVPPAGRAEISNGPVRFGTVEVASVRDGAYAQLEAIALRLSVAFVVVALLSGFLASLVLRRLRAPLAALVRQAQAISERHFVAMDEPRVPELASVTRAMNVMVQRVRAIFDENAARLEQLRDTVNHDALTRLDSRAHFMNGLAGVLDADENTGGGLILLARLCDLAGVNRRAGRAAADDMLCRAAAILARRAQAAHGLAGRLNGSDMALVLPGLHVPGETVRALEAELRAAGLVGPEGTVVVGGVRYEPGDTASHLLARADAALATAELWPGRAAEESPHAAAPLRRAEDWSVALLAALKKNRLQVVSYPVRAVTGAILHKECFARLDLDGNGAWVPAALFMPQVRRLDLCARFDMALAQHVLDEISRSGEPRALNLCADSLRDPMFAQRLLSLLDRSPALLSRLWVEMPDDVFRHADAFSALAADLHARGCKIGIERFGRDFSQVSRLHALQPDYVKVDASFVRDIEHDEGNRRFLAGICTLLKDIGCQVIADGVQTAEGLRVVAELGLDAAGGPAASKTT